MSKGTLPPCSDIDETRILCRTSETNINAEMRLRAVLATAAGARDESRHVGLRRAPHFAAPALLGIVVVMGVQTVFFDIRVTLSLKSHIYRQNH